MLKVKLPDGSVLEYSRHVCPLDVAADIGPRLARRDARQQRWTARSSGADALHPFLGRVTVSASPAHRQRDARSPRGDAPFVRPRDGSGGDAAVRRACSWLSGQRWRTGFYYDFLPGRARFRTADFPKIEAEMAKIIKEDEAFERLEVPRQEAIEAVREPGTDAQGGTSEARVLAKRKW